MPPEKFNRSKKVLCGDAQYWIWPGGQAGRAAGAVLEVTATWHAPREAE